MENFSFIKLNKQEEKDFNKYFNERSIVLLRFTLIVMIIASFLYYYLDFISAPTHYKIFWIFRTITVICIIIALILSYNKKIVIEYFQTIANLLNIIYNLSILAMIYLSSPEEKAYLSYYNGLMMIWITSIPMRIRLKPFLFNAFLISILYLYIAITKQHLFNNENINILINNLFFLFTTILAVIIADIVLENFIRKNFLDQKRLKLQYSELEQKNEEISIQSQILAEQKRQIEKRHRQVMEAINYAHYIQSAILPNKEKLKQILKDYFLIYLPKQIVSGDFYYVQEQNQYKIIALGDCTGHGVPGGFLVMLSISKMESILQSCNEIEKPHKILEKMREEIIHSLTASKDGLDIALCVIDKETNKLYFSGAFASALIVRKNQVFQIKGVNNPIAQYPVKRSFKTESFTLEKGDIIYLFSDGLPTQRHKENIPYTKKRLKEKIKEFSSMDINEQYSMFLKEIAEWTRDAEQLDDITILAFRYD